MPAPAELINLPHALTEIVVRQRPEYERVVRAIRWGEVPVWAAGSGQSLPAAEMLGLAFEDLLSCPLMVREASAFAEDDAGMLRPGSVVVVFADGTRPPQDAARAARKRGAQVLVVTGRHGPAAATDAVTTPAIVESDLALALPSSGAAAEGGLGAACLQHAAAAQLALICARQLARPESHLDRMERDWRDLPLHLDRMVGQLADGVTALARELAPRALILLVGDGYHGPAARRAAALARQRSRRSVIGLDGPALESSWLQALGEESAVLLISASSGRPAKAAVELAGLIKERGSRLFVITGSNHYDLIRQARLSLILPELSDLASSLLALALAGWVGTELVPLSPARRSSNRENVRQAGQRGSGQ
jgi:DNA-binding MurR/RpiR family transcriptional regulator